MRHKLVLVELADVRELLVVAALELFRVATLESGRAERRQDVAAASQPGRRRRQADNAQHETGSKHRAGGHGRPTGF
jgi:hypothetical protein